MLKNIDADAAMQMLYGLPVTLKTETIAVCGALSRVVSADVTAKIPVPPFDRSPFDGYAFRGEDTEFATRENPAVLKIVEEIPAGTQPKCEIKTGLAAKILTGAPIPKGADSTIKYEVTEVSGTELRIFKPVKPNTDVVYKGTDVMPGTMLAPMGTVVTAPVIASIANQGLAHVDVFKKPVITVISTGSELCGAGEVLRPAAIYDSNTHTISAYLAEAGCEPQNGGLVPDEPDIIAGQIAAVLQKSDMVITTGGASVGDYDWAVTSAERLGAEVLFWKTSMKPGGAIMAAVRDGKLILGLSGNPAAAALGLFRVAMPYIKKLCGRSDCFFPEIRVALKEAYRKDSPNMRVLRGRLEIMDSRAYFIEHAGQGSEATRSFVGCDLLGEIPKGSPLLEAGSIIKAYRI